MGFCKDRPEREGEPATRHLYVHVPFCRRKCDYCDFYSVPYEAGLVQRYVRALQREVSLCVGMLGEIETVYIGGGTPTVLEPGELETVILAVTARIRRTASCEFTVEANPATLDRGKVSLLRDCGVTRISLGVQSFSDEVLKVLGRGHTAAEAKEAVRLIADSFENFSVDLMYGVPLQSPRLWSLSLQQALAFTPPHISMYELTPEPSTRLFHNLESRSLVLPDEDTVVAMQEEALSEVGRCGYRRYEISNYCLAGFEVRHNVNCWRRGQYVGFGPAAHSFEGDSRRSHVSNLFAYCEALERGVLPIDQVWNISHEEAVRETVFLGLRTDVGIDLDEVVRGVGSDRTVNRDAILRKLEGFLDRGLMKYEEGRLMLTPMGTLLANPLTGEVMRAVGV